MNVKRLYIKRVFKHVYVYELRPFNRYDE